jgi:hypothetical protein
MLLWSDLSSPGFYSGCLLFGLVSLSSEIFCRSQSYFTTGGLPPISSSWHQAPWDPRPDFFFRLNSWLAWVWLYSVGLDWQKTPFISVSKEMFITQRSAGFQQSLSKEMSVYHSVTCWFPGIYFPGNVSADLFPSNESTCHNILPIT